MSERSTNSETELDSGLPPSKKCRQSSSDSSVTDQTSPTKKPARKYTKTIKSPTKTAVESLNNGIAFMTYKVLNICYTPDDDEMEKCIKTIDKSIKQLDRDCNDLKEKHEEIMAKKTKLIGNCDDLSQTIADTIWKSPQKQFTSLTKSEKNCLVEGLANMSSRVTCLKFQESPDMNKIDNCEGAIKRAIKLLKYLRGELDEKRRLSKETDPNFIQSANASTSNTHSNVVRNSNTDQSGQSKPIGVAREISNLISQLKSIQQYLNAHDLLQAIEELNQLRIETGGHVNYPTSKISEEDIAIEIDIAKKKFKLLLELLDPSIDWHGTVSRLETEVISSFIVTPPPSVSTIDSSASPEPNSSIDTKSRSESIGSVSPSLFLRLSDAGSDTNYFSGEL